MSRAPNRYGCICDHGKCKAHSLPTVGWWGCEKSSRKRDPVEGDIYEDEVEHRRVIHVGKGILKDPEFETDKEVTRVCYSNGGNTNHWISLEGFRSWFLHAKLVKDGRQPEKTDEHSAGT